jgi:hypothetical protein
VTVVKHATPPITPQGGVKTWARLASKVSNCKEKCAFQLAVGFKKVWDPTDTAAIEIKKGIAITITGYADANVVVIDAQLKARFFSVDGSLTLVGE